VALHAGRWRVSCNEDPGKDGRIIITWNFRKWNVDRAWTGSSWLRIGTVGGYL